MQSNDILSQVASKVQGTVMKTMRHAEPADTALSRLLKNAPFTLRQAQGERTCIKIIHNHPFVVSPSNHKKTFSTAC
jgi:hypothetical protein